MKTADHLINYLEGRNTIYLRPEDVACFIAHALLANGDKPMSATEISDGIARGGVYTASRRSLYGGIKILEDSGLIHGEVIMNGKCRLGKPGRQFSALAEEMSALHRIANYWEVFENAEIDFRRIRRSSVVARRSIANKDVKAVRFA